MPPQTQNVPKGFVPDAATEETPKGFVPDKSITHSAAPPDSRSASQVALDQMENVGKGVTGLPASILGTGKALVESLGSPAKQAELVSGAVKGVVGPSVTLGKNVLNLAQSYGVLPRSLNPTPSSREENEQMAQAAGANLASTLVAPVADRVIGAPIEPKLNDALTAPPHMQRSSIITLGSKGWRDSAPYGSPVAGADIVRDVLPQAMSELEHESGQLRKPKSNPVKEKFPTVGMGDAGKNAKLRAGETFVGSPTEEGITQRAVDITERPIQKVLADVGSGNPGLDRMDGAGQVLDSAAKTKIQAALESTAAAQDVVNPELAKSIRNMKTLVDGAQDWNALNELKKRANKESSRYGRMTEGGKIDASESIGAAWADLGDTIRAHMYPELERLYNESHPNAPVNLHDAGVQQSALIDFRNGASKSYHQAILEEGKHSASTALERFSTKGGSTSDRGILRRGIGAVVGKTPAGEFNTLVQRAMGRGGIPELPAGNTLYGPAQPQPGTIAGQQHDLIAHDGTVLSANDTGQHPLMPTPPGMSTSPNGVGEAIRRVQMRSDRQARSAPPDTLSGSQTHLPGANEAKPDTPFYPGLSGTHAELVPELDRLGKPTGKMVEQPRDYSNQNQLFSHTQTPYKWEPSKNNVSSTADLRDMASEIDHYVRTGDPPPTIKRQWEADLQSVRDEIYRREQAMRTPGKKNGSETRTGGTDIGTSPDTGQKVLSEHASSKDQQQLNTAPHTPTRLERSSGQVFTMPAEIPTNRGLVIEGATTGQARLPAGRILVTPAPPDVSRLTIYDAVKQVARDPKTGRMFKYFTADQGAEVSAGTKIETTNPNHIPPPPAARPRVGKK